MTLEQLRTLARHSVNRTAPAEFSVDSVDAAVSDGFKALAGSINDFLKNQYDIFSIIVENADEIVPLRVTQALGAFAEIQVVGQGVKAVFKKNVGAMRARKFITQVGLSGVYDTFRLDAESFSIPTIAIGGACTMDFERFLDGAESLSDLMNVLTDSLTDAVYIQVQKALIAAASNGARPAANLVSVNTYSADDLFELMGTVRAYGPNVVIFAAPEFIAKMGADAIVPVAASGNPVVGVYSPDDIENIHRTGYVRLFRGAPIVQIPQSFIDETNTKTWINPQYAYVLPAGKEKVVKVVLEGDTQMWAEVNKDRSIEVNAYKKMGCAVLTQYNWGIYQNKEIPDTSYSPYGF